MDFTLTTLTVSYYTTMYIVTSDVLESQMASMIRWVYLFVTSSLSSMACHISWHASNTSHGFQSLLCRNCCIAPSHRLYERSAGEIWSCAGFYTSYSRIGIRTESITYKQYVWIDTWIETEFKITLHGWITVSLILVLKVRRVDRITPWLLNRWNSVSLSWRHKAVL